VFIYTIFQIPTGRQQYPSWWLSV